MSLYSKKETMTKRLFVIKRNKNIQIILSKHCTLYPLREGFKTTVTKSTFPLSERIISLADKGGNGTIIQRDLLWPGLRRSCTDYLVPPPTRGMYCSGGESWRIISTTSGSASPALLRPSLRPCPPAPPTWVAASSTGAVSLHRALPLQARSPPPLQTGQLQSLTDHRAESSPCKKKNLDTLGAKRRRQCCFCRRKLSTQPPRPHLTQMPLR